MNAWIDCMSYLADEANDSAFELAPGETLCLVLPDCAAWCSRQPELFSALVDCAAAVNLRFAGDGDNTNLVLKPS